MKRAFSANTSASAPTAPASPATGFPTNGNPATGTPATVPGEYWFHMITEEMQNVVLAAGLTPSMTDLTQLLQSIKALSFPSYKSGASLPASNVGAIWHDDYASIMTWQTLSNNGIVYTGYASINVGNVAYFSSQTPPKGWLKCNGAALSASYAALQAATGKTTLIDARAEFLRGFDDGRGVDNGRVFGSAQSATRIPYIDVYAISATSGQLVTHPVSTLGTFPNENKPLSPDSEILGASGPYLSTPLTAYGLSNTIAYTVRPRNLALLACIKY